MTSPTGARADIFGNIPDEAPTFVATNSLAGAGQVPLGVMSGIDPALLSGVKETEDEEWMEELQMENTELKQRLLEAKREIATLKGTIYKVLLQNVFVSEFITSYHHEISLNGIV